jgi:hypothetical protein
MNVRRGGLFLNPSSSNISAKMGSKDALLVVMYSLAISLIAGVISLCIESPRLMVGASGR